MLDFATKKIVLGLSGGIAAYKTAYLVRELTALGAEVRIVMTQAAQKFISPLTMQALSGHPVRTSIFDEQAEQAMGHIELARWADYLVMAPTSANCMAKLAHGIADDLLTTLYLVAEVPVIICPAMNRAMWEHPATVANVKLLQQRGVIFIGPEPGLQACGEDGLGRLSNIEHIINALRLTEVSKLLSGQKLLITAGPTREAIDPVRFLCNHSSGKMGYALAQAAKLAGAEVTLISGPTALNPPPGVNIYYVETATEMHASVMTHLKDHPIFIGAAAVSDYRVQLPQQHKIKKNSSEQLTINLIPNPDIVADVIAGAKTALTIGFAAETTAVMRHAQEKFKRKKLDMLIVNKVGKNLGFNSDYNQVTILTKGDTYRLPLMHKVRLAGRIVAIVAAYMQNNK